MLLSTNMQMKSKCSRNDKTTGSENVEAEQHLWKWCRQRCRCAFESHNNCVQVKQAVMNNSYSMITATQHHSRLWIKLDWIVQCFTSPPTNSISYMGDGFYRSKDPTNSIKVLKEQIVHRQILRASAANKQLPWQPTSSASQLPSHLFHIYFTVSSDS